MLDCFSPDLAVGIRRVKGAKKVRMAQNFEWFEQLRMQHATLSGGILYNGLE